MVEVTAEKDHRWQHVQAMRQQSVTRGRLLNMVATQKGESFCTMCMMELIHCPVPHYSPQKKSLPPFKPSNGPVSTPPISGIRLNWQCSNTAKSSSWQAPATQDPLIFETPAPSKFYY